MRSLWCVFLILVAAGQGVNADDKDSSCTKAPNSVEEPNCLYEPNYPDDPNELLRVKWDAAIRVLQNKDIGQKVKAKQINKIVSPMFDFPLMAKLSLGRKHWPKLTRLEREKFAQLFAERLKSSYREKLSLYTDEKVLFKRETRKKAKRKGTIYIPMELVSKDTKVAMLYKLRQADVRLKVKADDRWVVKVLKRWKIYDVEIEGVSIVLTYRAQFDDILRRGSVKELLLRLEKTPPE